MLSSRRIMHKLRKILNNLCSKRAISVLGVITYARYISTFLVHVPKILRAGDLRSLDRAMGKSAKRFHYRGSTFQFDCEFCDEQLNQNSFAFGIVREIYIRDCYFKWLPASVYSSARKVIDLGANRGAFSTLMTTQAEFILSVECEEEYVPIIKHNMGKNNFTNFAVETAFIGGGV